MHSIIQNANDQANTRGKTKEKACLLADIHLNEWLHFVRLIVKADVVVRWTDRRSSNLEDDLGICLLPAEALLANVDHNTAVLDLSIFKPFIVTAQVRMKTLGNPQMTYPLA